MGEEWRKEADERRRCETGGGGEEESLTESGKREK